MSTGRKIKRLTEVFPADVTDDYTIRVIANALDEDYVHHLCDMIENALSDAVSEAEESHYEAGREQGWHEGYEGGFTAATCDECGKCPHMRAEEARELRDSGLSFEAIGKRLGVSRQRAHQIVQGGS